MRGKKILVIGGTGFLGFHLIKRCISLKMIITSISKQKPCQSQRFDNVEYKTCNITSLQRLKKQINNDYDFVVNLGGNIDHKNKNKTYRSHYLGVKNLYNIFKNKKLKDLFK